MNRSSPSATTAPAVLAALLAVSANGAPAAAPAAPNGPTAIERTARLDLAATSAPPAAATPEPYRLGIGDVLDISVYGDEIVLPSRVPVDPSGHVTYRIAGTVQAAGRTIDELRADLQARVSKELRHQVVTVVPAHFGSRNFTILGQVRVPGTYPIEGRMLLFDALATGGGLMSGQYRNSSADFYDLKHATLLRHGRTVPVDFEALIFHGDAAQNVPVESGDIITIPSALIRNVYVLGEVFYPRSVGMVSSLTLVQALTEARGLKDTASGKLVIVRGALTKPQATVVDARRLLDGGVRDIQLAPGDIVYAPRRSLELLDDIVKAAVNGFAAGAAAESAAGLYNKISGSSDSGQPVVVP